MPKHIKLGDLSLKVALKDIKNVHLSVHPPTGRVTISAPLRMSLDNIRVFAISKLGWIKQQQRKFQAQERETPREYLDRESHYVWGRRYLLHVVEEPAPPSIRFKHNKMILQISPGTNDEMKRDIVARWYRNEIKAAAPDLIEKWEPLLGVEVKRVFVQKMKTKWGSCNPRARSIRLNTDLAKKPRECLEYIIVHEMVHLIERHHNDRFRKYMDQFLPQWQRFQSELNSAPLAHEKWSY